MDYTLYDSFINDSKVFNEPTRSLSDTNKKLSALITPDMNAQIKKWLQWDMELFACCEIPIEHRTQDQNFLFPELVYTNGVKIPDIDNFESERFNFYRHRFEETSDLKVEIRYSNYFFQYAEKKEKYKYATELTGLLCEEISMMEFSHECVVNISRLFEVSLSFRIEPAIEKIDQIIKNIFTKEHPIENKIWLLAISRIVSNNIQKNKKPFLSDSTITDIIAVIENMLDYYMDTISDFNSFRNWCENYIDWIKILKDEDKMKKALIDYGNSYEKQAENMEQTNIAKASLYENAIRHFANIGEREKVYNLKIKIKNTFKAADVSGEFKTISTDYTITKEQLEDETVEFFKSTVNENFKSFSHAIDFVPRKGNSLEKATAEAENPIYQFVDFGHVMGNRKVFNARDKEDIIKKFLCFNYGIEIETTFSVLVKYIWDKMLQNGLTDEMVSSRICEIEYMSETQKELISVAIKKFFEDDYISCLHILVPQFESYFRTLFEWGGFPTTTIQADTAQYEQTFNEFLRQPYVVDIINSDMLFMIEFIMVEQLGKNLRNNIAHGLADLKTFSKTNGLIMIYLFFLITSIKWKF